MTTTAAPLSVAPRRPAALIALIVVQLFQAIGALGGGATLIASPKGGIMKMPLSNLDGSPFKDFLIPGVILFVVLGLGPLLATWVLIRQPRSVALERINPFPRQYWGWTLSGVIGVGLVIWIAVESLIVPYNFLQPFYACVGIVIIVLTLLPTTATRAAARASPPVDARGPSPARGACRLVFVHGRASDMKPTVDRTRSLQAAGVVAATLIAVAFLVWGAHMGRAVESGAGTLWPPSAGSIVVWSDGPGSLTAALTSAAGGATDSSLGAGSAARLVAGGSRPVVLVTGAEGGHRLVRYAPATHTWATVAASLDPTDMTTAVVARDLVYLPVGQGRHAAVVAVELNTARRPACASPRSCPTRARC
jgi:hypothetical protein